MKNTTSAQKLEPFNNIVTSGILVAIVVLILIGLLLITKLSFLGVISASLGTFMFVFGYTDIPSKPRTAGVLTLWGSFFTIGGKPVIVGGKTILASYFPFNLSCERIDITNHDKDIDMTVTSSDKAVLKGIMSITVCPDIEDAIDYIQAGGDIKEIVKQLDDIIRKKTREICSSMNSLDITQKSQPIEDQLFDYLKKHLDEKAFGVKILKIQAVFDQPDSVIKAMEQKLIEGYERDNEKFEYETNLIAAQQLQQAYASDPHMKGKVPTLEECLSQILEQRLIRDGKASAVNTKGGKTLNVNNVNPGGKTP